MSAASYKKMIERKPWMVSWRNARRRCIDINHTNYKYYGGKGIQFQLTKEECAFLWNRDKAWLLKNPELDRENANENYCLDNCRFIPKLDNLFRRKLNKKEDNEEKQEWTD